MPLSKQALVVLNNTNFPNNNTQYISPELLRQFNSEMIIAMQLTQSMSEYAVLVGGNSFVGNQSITGDLTVTGTLTVPVIHTIYETASVIYSSGSNQLGDELTDTQTLSGSVKVQGSLTINGIPVTAGQTTGSSLITASVNQNVITFTKGDSSQFNITVNTGSATNQDLGPLNAFTASQQIINSNVSSSIGLLNSKTGSYATTGSNTFTGNQNISKENVLYTNGIYWTSSEAGYNNLEIINSATGNLDLSALNGKVRVVNTSLVLTGTALSSSNDISTSANIYGANLTASAIPVGTISSSAQISALGFVSSSVTASSLITASLSGQTLTFTKGNGTTFGIVLPDVSGSDITSLNAFTASQLTINTGYNTFTQSIQTEVDSLQAATSSYAISSSVAAVDAAQQAQINSLINATSSYADSASFAASQLAQDNRINDLSAQTSSYITESETASFARTNVDNNFTANQTFTNITAVSASFTYVQTTYETSSIIYSSGSNQFGDELSDIQTLSGSVRVQGSLTINGTPVQTSSVDITSLNAFTASQETKNSTLATYTASVDSSLTNLNSFTASNGNTSLNAYTQSNDTKWSNLAGQTGSYVTSAITASSLVTASVNLNTITFTKGDASTFNITVDTGSGGGTLPSGLLSSSVTNFIDYSASVDSRLNAAGGAPQVQDEGTILGNATSFNFNGAGVTATLSAGTASITIPGGGGTIDTGSFLTTGSFNTSQDVRGAINFYPTGSTAGQAIRIYNTGSNASGSMILGITDPGSPFIQLQQKTWFQIQGSEDLNYVAFTASFDNGLGIGPNFGSRTQMLTSSGSLGLFNPTIQRAGVMNHLSASQAARNGVNLVFAANTRTGTTIISGSDNIFTNPQTPTTNYIRYVGGSNNLYLNSSNGIGTQITASAISVSGNRPTMNNNIFNGTGNFAINQAVNGGTHTYSSNYDNGNTTINAMAFTGSLTLSNNINNNGTITITPASASVAEIASGLSGSHTINVQGNGFFGGGITLTTNRIQPPSITYTISNNILAGVGITITNVSSSVGVSAQNNMSNGNITYSNAGAANLAVHRSAAAINTNIGTLNLIASASAINASNNICANAMLVTNRMYSGSYGSGSLTFNNNSVQGAGNTYTVSGSYNGTAAGSVFNVNAVFGNTNTFFTNVEGRGNYVNFASSGIFGGNLILTGSNNTVLTEQGGLHLGRYNANDGRRNTTGENIFSVGTGTSTTRKTGFLIDSGSNTFVEGTFNVSGSTSLTGSLTIQSGSSFFANGNKQFNVGTFQSDVTQSGSANVSQSMNFEVTDISSGVSIASNSRITLANSGTYNIQFSAQIDRVSGIGTDTVHIWLKKNGTNVSASAGAITISGTAAAAKTIAAWNYVVDAAASDYYELVWEATDSNIQLINQAAGGNIPSTPSIILTVTQVR